jgi:hypothetical protein
VKHWRVYISLVMVLNLPPFLKYNNDIIIIVVETFDVHEFICESEIFYFSMDIDSMQSL